MSVESILKRKGADVTTISPEASIKKAADWLRATNIVSLAGRNSRERPGRRANIPTRRSPSQCPSQPSRRSRARHKRVLTAVRSAHAFIRFSRTTPRSGLRLLICPTPGSMRLRLRTMRSRPCRRGRDQAQHSRPHQSGLRASVQHCRSDGSHSSAAVFYLNGRLYEIEGKVLPPESDALAIRFQQSLVFMRGVSNRSADVRQ
jgi:hypothetical protein